MIIIVILVYILTFNFGTIIDAEEVVETVQRGAFHLYLLSTKGNILLNYCIVPKPG